MHPIRALSVLFRGVERFGRCHLSRVRVTGRCPEQFTVCVTGFMTLAMSRRSPKNRSYGDFCKARNRVRVLLDMDMVLADFEGHFLRKYREAYPDEPYIKPEERNGFWLRDQYEKIRPGLNEKVRSIYEAEFFFRDLPELPGAVDAAKEISTMEDVDVFICTSPLTEYKYCLKEKFEWVETHLGAEWLEKVIIAKDKTMVNAHVLIDDRPNIRGAMLTPAWEQVVFTACHNVRSNIHGKRRLENWTDGQWRTLLEDLRKRI